MSDPTYPARRQTNRGLLFVSITLLIIAALAVYLLYGQARAPRRLKLALVTWTQDPFWQPLLRGAQDSADASNVDLTIVQSEPTVEAQTKHIRALLDGGVDGIAISPNDANAERTILDEATGKLPVVTFDTDAPDTKRRRFISIDNYAAGRICADEMREALPDGGPILISVGSVAMTHGRDRRRGLIDALLERGFDRTRDADPADAVLKGPKFSIVATATDGGDPARAVQAIAAALKAHPEVKGIVGLFSYSAPAALEAMKQVGRTGQIQVVGFDEADETQAAVAAGTIHSSVIQDSYHSGYAAIEVLANEARGIARGPAEQSPVLNVETNVMTDKNLSDLRQSKAIRQPAQAAATQSAAAQ